MKPGVTLSDDDSTEIAEPSTKKPKTTSQPNEITDPQEKSSNSQQANTVATPSSFETLMGALEKAKANSKELLLKQKSQQHSLTAIEWVVLASLHIDGVGTDKNPQEAFACIKKAIEIDKNYAPAWHNLGRCYEDGIGTDKNPQEAFACYKKATEINKNFHFAWNHLGRCYERGIGTDKNPEQALTCYKNSMQATPSGYARAAIARIEGKLATTCTNPAANTRTPSSVSSNANEPSQHSHTPSSLLTFSRSMPPNSTPSISPPYEHLKRENDLLRQENKILRERIELLQTTQFRSTNTFRS